MGARNDGVHKALMQRRREIDRLDAELLRLLNKRARIARALAPMKRLLHLPVHDRTREREIVDRICRENSGPLSQEGIAGIFRRIIRESRRAEETSMRRMKSTR